MDFMCYKRLISILPIVMGISSVNTALAMARQKDCPIKAKAAAIEKARFHHKHAQKIQEATNLLLPLAHEISELTQDRDEQARTIVKYLWANNVDDLYCFTMRATGEEWMAEKSKNIALFKAADPKSQFYLGTPQDFSNTNFSGLDRSNCRGTVGALLAPCVWLYTNFTRADLSGHMFPQIFLAHKTNCTEADFTGSTFGSEEHSTDLTKANFDRAILKDCTLINTSLGWKNLLKLEADSIKTIKFDEKSLDLLAHNAQAKFRATTPKALKHQEKPSNSVVSNETPHDILKQIATEQTINRGISVLAQERSLQKMQSSYTCRRRDYK